MTAHAPARAISTDEIDAFERDGYVVLRDVLLPEWLNPLRDASERLLASPDIVDITDEAVRLQPLAQDGLFGAKSYAAVLAKRGHFYVHFNTAQCDTAVLEFALRGAAGGIAAALMRSSTARFIDDVFFVKEPGTEESTEWHDDDGGGITTGSQRCSLWISLGDVPAEAGPLRLLRGSHRRFAGWRSQGLQADALVAAHPEDVALCPIRVGDVVAHYLSTIHGTGPNRSSRPRCTWAMRFGGDSARFAPSSVREDERASSGLDAGAPLHGPRFPVAWPPAI
jgi:ectoine hydroxylase-related dioxygenase (phytanoyl-CoA dioxygenase family)